MTTGNNPFKFGGRRILVTGGSSGIGRETAVVLAELGAQVIVTGRRASELDATISRMPAGDHASEPFDLEQLEAIPEWVKGLASRYGPFHGFAHAAGMHKTVGLAGLSLNLLHQTFRVNFDSAVMLAKGFRQKGCLNPNASLVFFSSVTAIVGLPATSAYAASKAALTGLTRSLASELARQGVRVNCIAPGVVRSDMSDRIRQTIGEDQFAALIAQHPLGAGTPWDVAWAAAYLLSDAAAWMTGQTLVLDGGYSSQ